MHGVSRKAISSSKLDPYAEELATDADADADETGHVAIGKHWYRHLCAQRGLEPVATYALLARPYEAPRLRGPLKLDAASVRALTRRNWRFYGLSGSKTRQSPTHTIPAGIFERR